MTLPPTVDEAIRLIRRQRGAISTGDLADVVISRGWNVDRAELVARIRELFPGQKSGSSQSSSAAIPVTASRRNAKVKPRGAPEPVGRKRKRPKAKVTQEYCPKCHAFVVMTRLSGATTIADHVTKKGDRCSKSGQKYTPKSSLKSDALEFRVPGSFGTGKRR